MNNNLNQLQKFVVNVSEAGLVWGIKGDDGWATSPSVEYEDTEVFPFFSSSKTASLLCVDEWQHYAPVSLSLKEFIEDWLPGMHEDNVMLGLEWNADLDGPELEPAEVADAFA